MTLPDDLQQEVSKAICCVRNPIDVIVSEFNTVLTWTHNKSPEGNQHILHAEKFDKLIKDKIL